MQHSAQDFGEEFPRSLLNPVEYNSRLSKFIAYINAEHPVGVAN